MRWSPGCGETIAEVPPNGSHSAGRPQYVGGQVALCKTPKYGNNSIVATHRMKSEEPCHDPETGCREPTAPEVAHDHGTSSDAMHLAQNKLDLVILEVMQHLRARHHVDAGGRERKRSRVAAHASVEHLAGNGSQRCRFVETNRVEPDALPTCERPRPKGYVRKAGADVEQARICGQRRQKATHLSEHRIGTAQHRVRAANIAERSLAQGWAGVRIIEVLEPAAPRRRDQACYRPSCA